MTRKTRNGWDCSALSEHILSEPALAVAEPLQGAAARRTVFRRIFSKLRTPVRIEMPTGYQDETGFHSGVKPVEKEIQWPPVW